LSALKSKEEVLKNESALKSPSGFKRVLRAAAALVLLALIFGLATISPAKADSAGGAWELLDSKSTELSNSNHSNGIAYLISGGAALAISLPGYYLSDDVFAKTVYSLTETLSVASVGYGTYLMLIDDDVTRFVRIVKGSPGVGAQARNQLATAYLHESADRARNVRKIRVISHGLTAALNFVNGVTSSQKDLATALYFLGGVNTLAAVGFAISKSDEEKLVESREAEEKTRKKVSMEFFVGPVSGLAFRF
jgi:hypothetical protein